MHLLLVVPAYAPFVGGAQTLCRALARRLVSDGHQVTIVTTNAQRADDYWQPPAPDRPVLSRQDEVDGAAVVRVGLFYPWPAPYHFGLLRRATHYFARLPLRALWQKSLLRHFTRSMPPVLGLQSDLPPLVDAADMVLIVDAGWDGFFVGAAQAAFAQTRPLIVVPLIHTGSPTISAHFRMAHQLAVYRQADATIALSEAERGLLAEWGVEEDRLYCVPLGLEQLAEEDEGKCPGLAGLPERFVLFLGASTYDKGAYTLVQAAAELARQGQAVDVVFVGPQQHQLAVFIDTQPAGVRATLKERVHLLGVVDNETKQTLLSGCTVLALPSRVDSFGIVVLEAWQHGKPVVVAAVGGPETLVTPDETGLLVPFDEPVALAKALHRILHEPGLAARLGAAGRQTVRNQYTWDKCYDALHQIFDHVQSSPKLKRDAATSQYQNGRSDERL